MKLTPELIEENIKRVDEGKALNIPLAVLNGEFMKVYHKETERIIRKLPEVKERQRQYMRKYLQKPGAKERQRQYMREYIKKPRQNKER